MSTDPALSFWMRYAEREGALSEDDAVATTLMVLPEVLQRRHDLPEETTFTGDPDVAREDGALLVAPGHPIVQHGADLVLAEGDVGVERLSWPASTPPDRGVLEGRARDSFAVDHGRIDAVDAPHHAYLPVLRAGALVTYEVSLDTRFQEPDEVWVDATSCVAIPDQTVARLSAHFDPAAERTAHRRLPARLAAATASANAILRRRAVARLAGLDQQAADARDAELARAAVYYDAAFASIRRRQATASAERAELLDAQAEVTRAERERRVAEIHEKFRPRHRLRPFRLHLVLVPAVSLAVQVRRGPRAYPWELVWLPQAATFAAVACPHCGTAEPWLVAGRDRLGCQACLT